MEARPVTTTAPTSPGAAGAGAAGLALVEDWAPAEACGGAAGRGAGLTGVSAAGLAGAASVRQGRIEAIRARARAGPESRLICPPEGSMP